jgi:hypothetical protein
MDPGTADQKKLPQGKKKPYYGFEFTQPPGVEDVIYGASGATPWLPEAGRP